MAPRTSSASSPSAGGRRRRGEPEPEEDEDVNPISEDEVDETPKSGLSEDDLRTLSAKLIRYAFAMERNKKPLKRSECSFIPSSRLFPAVYARAQETLKKTFGMEFIELGQKFKVGDDLAAELEEASQAAATQAAQAKKKGKGRRMADIEEEDEDNDEEEALPQAKKKPKVKATGLFVLRSTLPPALLKEMANPKALPLAENARRNEDAEHGSLIDWENGDSTQTGHVALLGIRTIILCLIMCNHRVMSDDQLHNFLRRLGIYPETPLPYQSSTSPLRTFLTLDKFLDLLDRQLYLQKVKIATPGSADGHSIEWRWGQRQAEFSEQAAAKFIEQIMFHGREEEDEEEEEVGGQRRRGAAADNGVASIREQRVTMRKDLQRAVGGELRGEV